MSRSGYGYDCENLALYRGQVASAIRGKRGQAFLRDLVRALDAMPEKRLIADRLEDRGEVCLLGCALRARGQPLDDGDNDEFDHEIIAMRLNIAECLAAESAFQNDEGGPWSPREDPDERWVRVRAWAVSNLREDED